MFDKTLWIAFEHTPDDLIAKAKEMGASGVAIRTVNPLDRDTIGRYHDQNLKVYGWLFPAVVRGSEYRYALDEADYVASKLVPAGLDGYFFDPEGSDRDNPRNWDQPGLEELAKKYCKTIKDAIPPGRPFLFGLSSHYLGRETYPHLPWSVFVDHSEIMLPQSYWRYEDNHQSHNIGHGPKRNYEDGKAAWSRFANGKKVLPMAGELGLVTKAEIEAHALAAAGRSLHEAASDSTRTELHFYTDDLSKNQQIFRDIGQLGRSPSLLARAARVLGFRT
jgi:hypothetical protein